MLSHGTPDTHRKRGVETRLQNGVLFVECPNVRQRVYIEVAVTLRRDGSPYSVDHAVTGVVCDTMNVSYAVLLRRDSKLSRNR